MENLRSSMFEGEFKWNIYLGCLDGHWHHEEYLLVNI